MAEEVLALHARSTRESTQNNHNIRAFKSNLWIGADRNTVDTTKAAVFNMETQMFMLESAMEDRHVKKALDEAASAIAGFQQNIGDPNAVVVDLKNMSASLPELEVGDSTDEELMEELEQWLSPEDRRKAQQHDDNISLLSVPTFLPAAPVYTPTTPSVDRILNAVIGE